MALKAPGTSASKCPAGTIVGWTRGSLASSGKSFAQSSDDRDASADAGFESDRQIIFASGPEDFLAMLGEQRFVRGNDVLARAQCPQNKAVCRFIAAEHLDDDIDIG